MAVTDQWIGHQFAHESVDSSQYLTRVLSEIHVLICDVENCPGWRQCDPGIISTGYLSSKCHLEVIIVTWSVL